MLRVPNGCFEQTSSSAYPNILIIDYLRKNKISSPKLMMESERLLNLGYQRLLTFERPGGGFDWWVGDHFTIGLRARYHGISMQPPDQGSNVYISAMTVEGSIALHF